MTASYKVALRIAKEKKTHTIGERLIKPCAVEMAETVCGKDVAKKFAKISLSNNVVKSRINEN